MRIQPDVLVKGADWAEDAIVGRASVEARGGRVVRVAIEQGYSTTALLKDPIARLGIISRLCRSCSSDRGRLATMCRRW